jgi:lauroyl/myristoyl acyltransferase
MTTVPVAHQPRALTVARDAALPAPRWYAHRLNRVTVYRATAALAAALPRRARLSLAAAVGAALARRFPAERAVVRTNLAHIVAGATPAAREALVAGLFRNFAICFADLLVANRRGSCQRLLAGVEGLEHLVGAGRDGRGFVVLTAHLGNWELAGRTLAGQVQRPTHVVVAAELDPGVERFLRGGPAPVHFVVRGDPTQVLPLVTALRRGEVVAMQGDRALGTRGDVGVPFFGAAAVFPVGPFVLARAAGVPIVPSFCVLGADRRYTVRVSAPIAVGEDAAGALTAWVAVLETAVREHPDQWFNFFDVWSDGPGH